MKPTRKVATLAATLIIFGSLAWGANGATLTVYGDFHVTLNPNTPYESQGGPNPIRNQGILDYDGSWSFELSSPTVFIPDSGSPTTMTLSGNVDFFFALFNVSSNPLASTTINELTFDNTNVYYAIGFDNQFEILDVSIYSGSFRVIETSLDDLFLSYSDVNFMGDPLPDLLAEAYISSATESSSFHPADLANSGNLGQAFGSYSVIPEPASSVLILFGGLCLFSRRRRK